MQENSSRDSIYHLISIPLKGSQGEELDLCYKTSKLFVGLGIYCKNDGYVLTRRDDRHSYFAFPDQKEVERFQAAGMLPQPLPTHKVPFWDYLIGYSLWWIALIVMIYPTLKARLVSDPHLPVSVSPVIR